MKRLLVLGCLLVVGAIMMAAAPANNSANSYTAAVTVDSAADVTWQKLDSVIVLKTDTCNVHYQYSAVVTLWPGQAIYIGLFKGATAKATDTVLYPNNFEGPFQFTVGGYYKDSLRTQTDATDTIFIRGAVGGRTEYENVACSSLYISGAVIDVN